MGWWEWGEGKGGRERGVCGRDESAGAMRMSTGWRWGRSGDEVWRGEGVVGWRMGMGQAETFDADGVAHLLTPYPLASITGRLKRLMHCRLDGTRVVQAQQGGGAAV
mgnify:CR=1 FL=1